MKIFTIIVTVIAIFSWFLNPISLNKVTKAERELKMATENLEELEKELDKKIIYYDSKLDLSSIKLEMEKKEMSLADNIVYFEIEE